MHCQAQCHFKMAKRKQGFSEQTDTQLIATHLDHYQKKQYITSSVSQPAIAFCIQDCCSWVAKVEYQGQARNTPIFEHINTSYSMLRFKIVWS